jgi:hypothetical protein
MAPMCLSKFAIKHHLPSVNEVTNAAVKTAPKIEHAKNTVPKDLEYVGRPVNSGNVLRDKRFCGPNENGKLLTILEFVKKNASNSFSPCSLLEIRSLVLWSIFQNTNASIIIIGPIIAAQYEFANCDLDWRMKSPAPISPVSSVIKN